MMYKKVCWSKSNYNFYTICNIQLRSVFTDCEQSPGVYLRDEVQNYSELRVPSAEKAAYYLDSALSGRSTHAHFLFTLHVYQYNVAAKGAGSHSPQ